MDDEILVQFYSVDGANCEGDSHTVLIGGDIYGVCACGRGCNGTLDIRGLADTLNDIVRELDEVEEGIDLEDEEEEY